MSYSYYATPSSRKNDQSSDSSNSILDALMTAVKKDNGIAPEMKSPYIDLRKEPIEIKTVSVSDIENQLNEPITEIKTVMSKPDLSNATVVSENNSDDTSSDDSMPPLIDDSDDEEMINEVIKNDEITKPNFVVKVTRTNLDSPREVFCETGILKPGENVTTKLKEMTKNTPYMSIIDDVLNATSPMTSLFDTPYIPRNEIDLIDAICRDYSSPFSSFSPFLKSSTGPLFSRPTTRSANDCIIKPRSARSSILPISECPCEMCTRDRIKEAEREVREMRLMPRARESDVSGLDLAIALGITALTIGVVGGLMALNDKSIMEIKKKKIEIVEFKSEFDSEDLITEGDLEFFRDYFKNFDGDVSTLSTKYRAIYDFVQDEFERKKSESEEEEEEDEEDEICEEEEEESKPYVAPVLGYTDEGKEMRLRQDGTIDVDTSVPGWYFNEMYTNCKIIKMTNDSGIHNGFHFVEGLNIDVNSFKYDEECGPDGLYFCREADAENWFSYGSSDMAYAWDVEIPSDARVVVYDNKIKADKFMLTNKRTLASMVAEKVKKMIYRGQNTSSIVNYVERYAVDIVQSEEIEELMIDLISIDPEAFSYMNEKIQSATVCAIAASIYDQAFFSMPEEMMHDEQIVYQCVEKNEAVFAVLPEAMKTQAVSFAAVDGNIMNYESVSKECKTQSMAANYLDFNPAGTSHVPKKHKNHREMIDIVLQCNPYELESIEFKNLTKERVTAAVVAEGRVLPLVPFSMLDYDLCTEAIKNTAEAYAHVPNAFRDTTLREILVQYHPEAIKEILPNEVTLDMVETIVRRDEALVEHLDHTNSTVRRILLDSMSDLITLNPKIVMHLGKDIVSVDDALQAIKAQPAIYWYVNQNYENRSDALDFTVRAVKRGVQFSAIPKAEVTMDILVDLVRSRPDMINELPERYRSDNLYIVAIKDHDFDTTKIPSSFMTLRLQNEIAKANPESVQAIEADVNSLEMEIEKSLSN